MVTWNASRTRTSVDASGTAIRAAWPRIMDTLRASRTRTRMDAIGMSIRARWRPGMAISIVSSTHTLAAVHGRVRPYWKRSHTATLSVFVTHMNMNALTRRGCVRTLYRFCSFQSGANWCASEGSPCIGWAKRPSPSADPKEQDANAIATRTRPTSRRSPPKTPSDREPGDLTTHKARRSERENCEKGVEAYGTHVVEVPYAHLTFGYHLDRGRSVHTYVAQHRARYDRVS